MTTPDPPAGTPAHATSTTATSTTAASTSTNAGGTAPTTFIVDDRRFIAEAYRDLLVQAGHHVEVYSDPSALTAQALAQRQPDLALVDLSFPDHAHNGLDVLLALHVGSPGTRAVVLSQADAPFQELLRVAWDALPLAGAISKDLLPAKFLRAVADILAGGVVVDPLMRLYLPEQRRRHRALDSYAHLMQHAGHARLWEALATSEQEPDYAVLRRRLGTSHNTIKNYRQTLAMLLEGFWDHQVASLSDLYGFARTTRPLLLHAARPHLRT